MANKKNTRKKKSGAKKNNSTNVKSITEKVSVKAEDTEEISEQEVEVIDFSKEEKDKTISQAKKDLVYADSGNNEIGKLIKIVLIVTIIMIIFYGVTIVVTKSANSTKKKEKAKDTSIQYSKIIVGTMLDKNGDYYVLLEKDDDEHLSEYKNSLQMVGISDQENKVYEIDLSSSFNSKYLSDEGNYSSNLDEFKVKGTTLIKVSDHNIVENYDNYDSIKAKLEELK